MDKVFSFVSKYLKQIVFVASFLLAIMVAALQGFGVDFNLKDFLGNVKEAYATFEDLSAEDKAQAQGINQDTGPPIEYVPPAE